MMNLLSVFLRISIYFIAGLNLSCVSVQTNTSERVALVIGNSDYLNAEPIPNPVNDADIIAEKLEAQGFNVLKGLNLKTNEMQRYLHRFQQQVPLSKEAVFYYAGHGMQISGENHLIPVDASFSEDLISEVGGLASQTIELGQVITVLDQSPGAKIVLLDACRDNPLTTRVVPSGVNQRGLVKIRDKNGEVIKSALIGRGLAQVESDNMSNLLIAFSTQPGNVALDGLGINSPFTESLIKYIPTPGLEIRELLTEVRKDVMQNTGNQQIPWDQSSLTMPFSFRKSRKIPPPPL